MQLDLGPVLGGLNVSPFFGNKYMISGGTREQAYGVGELESAWVRRRAQESPTEIGAGSREEV